MDFDEFEQLVLKVLFETDVPVTAAHVAYLGRISVRTAERHLARMVEQGTLNVRTNAAGIVEYVYPGRKPIATRVGDELAVGPPPISVSDGVLPDAATAAQPGHVGDAVDADSGRRPHLLRPPGRRRRLDGDHADGLRLLLPARPVPARPLPGQRRADAPRLSQAGARRHVATSRRGRRPSGLAAGGHPIDRRRLEAVFLALAQLPQLVERASATAGDCPRASPRSP